MNQLECDGRLVYRMLDNPQTIGTKREGTPALPLIGSWDDCTLWNSGVNESSRFYGIFWTVNYFAGARKIENLKKILSWSVDIDDGSKESQREKIKNFLQPSLVIETKRGYQCYWNAIDAQQSNYDGIQKGLVKHFGGDNNARDLARILRVPGYLHQKDPAHPFKVSVAFNSESRYCEAQMLRFLPKEKIVKEISKEEVRKQLHFVKSDDVFERIYNLDCEQGLRILSGSSAVSGESFSFKRTSGGKLNLLVDGKGTSVFIDSNKRIGSSDGGGPTLLQWLKWYNGSYATSMQVMKEYFPEVFRE